MHRKILFCIAMISALSWSSRALALECTGATCRYLESCEQATYELYVCGASQRDGDNDGIPCEILCGEDGSRYRDFLGRTFPDLLAAFESTSGNASILAPNAPQDMDQQKALALTPQVRSAPSSGESAGWACGEKRRCRQMTSCEEARFHLEVCGARGLDGNGDGIPCNSLCRKRR